MNAEQKQRAKDALQKWHSSNDDSLREYQSAELMAEPLQELIDAPETEPVAWRYEDAFGTHFTEDYSEISNIPGVLSFTALFAAPPHQSEHHLEMVNTPAPTPAEPPADVARDAEPDVWRIVCGDWRDETVAIHNFAGYVTCGLSLGKAVVLVKAHNCTLGQVDAAIEREILGGNE